MIDKDLETLKNTAHPAAGVLDGLEYAVRQRITAHERAVHTRQVVLRWQAATVAVVIMAGVALGRLALPHAVPDGLNVFSAEDVPAPSTLLLGSHT